MATVKQTVGTRTAVTFTGLSTLAANTYAVSAVVNNTTDQPLDILAEFRVTPGTVSGNKQVLLFVKASLDNTNWSTGPESGTTATDEAVLTFIGVVPVPTNSTEQAKVMSVAAAFGGVLPPYVKFVAKNESGAALTDGSLSIAQIHTSIA